MSSRGRTIVFGVLAGAVTGLVAAMLINRRAEEQGTSTAITTGDGVRLGVLVFGLLRAIASMGEEDSKKQKKK